VPCPGVYRVDTPVEKCLYLEIKALFSMCGIIGVWSPTPKGNIELLLLGADYLERRGPEGVGIASINPHRSDMKRHSANTHNELEDFVTTAKRDVLEGLRAQMGLVQTRYITDDRPLDKKKVSDNTQPIDLPYDGAHNLRQRAIIVHNGQVERKKLLQELITHAVPSPAEVDTRYLGEYLMQQIRVHEGDEWLGVKDTMNKLVEIDGAASVGASTGESLLFFRGAKGYRPLAYAKVQLPGDDAPSHVVVSETGYFRELINRYGEDCVLELNEVQPGEMIRIDKDGNLERRMLVDIREMGKSRRVCAFEEVYLKDRFSKNGAFDGSCNGNRKDLGAAVAAFYRDKLQEAEVVVPAVNSGISYAAGVSFKLSLQYDSLLGKPQTGRVGARNFLQAKKDNGGGKSHKFTCDRDEVEGKNIVVVDDSIMRGGTVASIYATLKDAGAQSVTVLAIWPPTVESCYHGVDFKNKELIAAKLVNGGTITYDGDGEIQYDIHQVNDRVTELIKDKVRDKYDGKYGEMDDFKVLYGTIPILQENLSTDENCTDCIDGSYQFREKEAA
jgi:amidophosphoribosyltransferase